jgi:hypothetical protein
VLAFPQGIVGGMLALRDRIQWRRSARVRASAGATP